MVSTREEQQSLISKSIIIVIPNECPSTTESLASLVLEGFERLGSSVEIRTLQAIGIDVAEKTIVSLLEYEESFLEKVQETQFNKTKHFLLHSAETLWVTRSDVHETSGSPAKRMISGLLRCLKMEDASRRVYELHLCRDPSANLDSAARAICRRLSSLWEAKGDEAEEMETVEQSGVFCIPRYVPEKPLNHSLSLKGSEPLPETGKLIQPNRPLKLTIGRPGMLDTLHFVDDETSLQPLADEEVEIETKACALNFL